jgi:hypothetical protein
MSKERRIAILLVGSALMVVGYFLPWDSVTFTPPGGSTVIDRQRYSGFVQSFSAASAGNTSTVHVLRNTIIVLAALAIVQLVGLLVEPVGQILDSKVASFVLGQARGFAHVIQAVGVFGFFLLVLGLGKIAIHNMFANQFGNTPDAIQASHYIALHFGLGFWLLLIGFILAIVPDAKEIGISVAIIVAGCIILAFVHPAWIKSFFEYAQV